MTPPKRAKPKLSAAWRRYDAERTAWLRANPGASREQEKLAMEKIYNEIAERRSASLGGSNGNC